MIPQIGADALLAWNHEAAEAWKGFLESNPALLSQPCDLARGKFFEDFLKHVWGVELRWASRLAGRPDFDPAASPLHGVEALYPWHLEAHAAFLAAFQDPSMDWDATWELQAPWIPPERRVMSRRKILFHALFHSQRHYSQMATFARERTGQSPAMGDFLLSGAMD